MITNRPTLPTYTARSCRRCNGTGQHSNYGGDTRCFSCKGTGSEMVESGARPVNDEEYAAIIDYQHGLAHVENRAFDRAARKAARA